MRRQIHHYILFIGCLYFSSTFGQEPWETYAIQEYGAKKGRIVYNFLKSLCVDCDTLVKIPGIIAHYEELQKIINAKPLESGLTPQAYLAKFKELLGRKIFYRGLALTSSEYNQLMKSHAMSASEAGAEIQLQKSVKQSVEHHLLKWRNEKSPILSVTDYPDIAAIVAKGYANNADKLVYLFEIEIPKLDVWGYLETFGVFPTEMEPTAKIVAVENLGEKKTIVTQNVVDNVRATISWDVYEQSSIVREVSYDSQLESFVYGEISNSLIRSVKVFSQDDLKVYDLRPILPEERSEVLEQFAIKSDPEAKKRFFDLLNKNPSIYSVRYNCDNLYKVPSPNH